MARASPSPEPGADPLGARGKVTGLNRDHHVAQRPRSVGLSAFRLTAGCLAAACLAAICYASLGTPNDASPPRAIADLRHSVDIPRGATVSERARQQSTLLEGRSAGHADSLPGFAVEAAPAVSPGTVFGEVLWRASTSVHSPRPSATAWLVPEDPNIPSRAAPVVDACFQFEFVQPGSFTVELQVLDTQSAQHWWIRNHPDLRVEPERTAFTTIELWPRDKEVTGVVVDHIGKCVQGASLQAISQVDGRLLGSTSTTAEGTFAFALPATAILVQFDPRNARPADPLGPARLEHWPPPTHLVLAHDASTFDLGALIVHRAPFATLRGIVGPSHTEGTTVVLAIATTSGRGLDRRIAVDPNGQFELDVAIPCSGELQFRTPQGVGARKAVLVDDPGCYRYHLRP